MIHASFAHGFRTALGASFGLVLLLAAGAAAGANLTDLRIGVHGDHTRIVLETDSAAPYIVDTKDREVIVHVDAAAAAETVTAKSPHLAWAKVEPTPIGADVRLQLKQPADVKAMVLTGPHRIVLDLYPRQAVAAAEAPKKVVASKPSRVAEPLPAPELLPPEPEPSASAEAKPAPSDEVPPPTPEELAQAESELNEPEGEAPRQEPPPEAPSAEKQEPQASASVPAPTPTAKPKALAGPGKGTEIRVPMPPPGKPPRPAPEPPSGGLFGSPYLLATTAVVLFALFLFLRRRLRRPEKFSYPEPPEEEAPIYEPPYEAPQRAVPVEAPAAGGESLFDVEADVMNAIPKDEERVPRPAPAEADSGDETQRRMAHLERRIEELVDARERVERQLAAQTEELRVQRAAIARTQRVLRTVAPRTDEDSSEPVVRG